MLTIATIGFAVNFWAWALVGPLGGYYTDTLGLDAVQKSLLVAVPVLVGSLGRIPVGALTDRFGARTMFPLITALTILPVLFIGYVGSESYSLMLLGGFVLGLGGTTFAIGVPLVNAWFPPAKRGMAIGIFGAGMGGTAISAFTHRAAAQDATGWSSRSLWSPSCSRSTRWSPSCCCATRPAGRPRLPAASSGARGRRSSCR